MRIMETEGRLKRIAAIAGIVGRAAETFMSLVEQLGLKPLLVTLALGVTAAIVTWFRDNVPWYVSMLLCMAFVAVALWIYHRILLIRATSKFDARKYRQFGRQLVELSEEIFRFLADRARDRSDIHRRNPAGLASHESWQEDRDFEHITGQLFFESFGPRVLSSMALLRQLGVTLPGQALSLAHFRPEGVPKFLATIGQLLAEGHIKQAIDVSNDRDFMWDIGN